ncbi:hypothetical protein VNO77_44585 [Canavalia gladiata]|uniref:Uncharacterized protein n=1 Tax=Canavalia gladiata TaxID=3824 RepID=A0AAN9PQI5_CANGL
MTTPWHQPRNISKPGLTIRHRTEREAFGTNIGERGSMLQDVRVHKNIGKGLADSFGRNLELQIMLHMTAWLKYNIGSFVSKTIKSCHNESSLGSHTARTHGHSDIVVSGSESGSTAVAKLCKRECHVDNKGPCKTFHHGTRDAEYQKLRELRSVLYRAIFDRSGRRYVNIGSNDGLVKVFTIKDMLFGLIAMEGGLLFKTCDGSEPPIFLYKCKPQDLYTRKFREMILLPLERATPLYDLISRDLWYLEIMEHKYANVSSLRSNCLWLIFRPTSMRSLMSSNIDHPFSCLAPELYRDTTDDPSSSVGNVIEVCWLRSIPRRLNHVRSRSKCPYLISPLPKFPLIMVTALNLSGDVKSVHALVSIFQGTCFPSPGQEHIVLENSCVKLECFMLT